MREKTLEEEIPVTREGLFIYRKGIQKQLDIYDPMVKRLKRALKITDERLSKIRPK